MPVVVVTRLRLRDPASFDEFFATLWQLSNRPRNRKAIFLPMCLPKLTTPTGRELHGKTVVPWTPSSVRNRTLSTMSRIRDWCDEATFIDWEQTGEEVPDWHDGYRRLVASGQSATLSHPTEAHHTRDFPEPVVT